MKYLKYAIICIAALFFIPSVTKAQEQTVDYKKYSIGDEIEVTLNENGLKGKFRVIEASEAHRDLKVEGQPVKDTTKDYQFVTAIYEGVVGESVYTKTIEEAVAFKDSNLYSNLIITTKDLKWNNIEEVRLMNKADMIRLFDSDSPGSESVREKYPWLVLDRTYWFEDDGQAMISYVDCGSECPKIKYVAKAMNQAGSYMYYEQENSASIRPVIKIHKAFIEGGMVCICDDCEEPPKEEKFCPNDATISIQACLDSGEKEEQCIQKLCSKIEPPKEEKLCPNDTKISIQSCIDSGEKEEQCIQKLCPGTKKPENPKTGVRISIGLLFMGIILGIICSIINKKNYFKNM